MTTKTKLSLRERRRKALLAKIDRLHTQYDAAIDTIVRARTMLPKLERQLRRYECAPAITPTAPSVEPPLLGGTTPPIDDGVPEFLRRTPNENRAAAGLPPIEESANTPADDLAAQIEERRKAKAHGRIAKMKAKKSGATKAMPLQGRDATRFISGK